MTALVLPLFMWAAAVAVHALNNGLGRVPQMGWNSWNHFWCGITEDIFKDVARSMVSSGLAKAGVSVGRGRRARVSECG